MSGDGVWRAVFDDGGGVLARGWHAQRSEYDPSGALSCEFHGPFADEAGCRAWVAAENDRAADRPIIVEPPQ